MAKRSMMIQLPPTAAGGGAARGESQPKASTVIPSTFPNTVSHPHHTSSSSNYITQQNLQLHENQQLMQQLQFQQQQQQQEYQRQQSQHQNWMRNDGIPQPYAASIGFEAPSSQYDPRILPSRQHVPQSSNVASRQYHDSVTYHEGEMPHNAFTLWDHYQQHNKARGLSATGNSISPKHSGSKQNRVAKISNGSAYPVPNYGPPLVASPGPNPSGGLQANASPQSTGGGRAADAEADYHPHHSASASKRPPAISIPPAPNSTEMVMVSEPSSPTLAVKSQLLKKEAEIVALREQLERLRIRFGFDEAEVAASRAGQVKPLEVQDGQVPHVGGLPLMGIPYQPYSSCTVSHGYLQKLHGTSSSFVRKNWRKVYVVADDRGVYYFETEHDYKRHAFHKACGLRLYRECAFFVPYFRASALNMPSEGCSLYHPNAVEPEANYFGFVLKQPAEAGSNPVNPVFLLKTNSAEEHHLWVHFFARHFNPQMYKSLFPMLFPDDGLRRAPPIMISRPVTPPPKVHNGNGNKGKEEDDNEFPTPPPSTPPESALSTVGVRRSLALDKPDSPKATLEKGTMTLLTLEQLLQSTVQRSQLPPKERVPTFDQYSQCNAMVNGKEAPPSTESLAENHFLREELEELEAEVKRLKQRESEHEREMAKSQEGTHAQKLHSTALSEAVRLAQGEVARLRTHLTIAQEENMSLKSNVALLEAQIASSPRRGSNPPPPPPPPQPQSLSAVIKNSTATVATQATEIVNAISTKAENDEKHTALLQQLANTTTERDALRHALSRMRKDYRDGITGICSQVMVDMDALHNEFQHEVAQVASRGPSTMHPKSLFKLEVGVDDVLLTLASEDDLAADSDLSNNDDEDDLIDRRSLRGIKALKKGNQMKTLGPAKAPRLVSATSTDVPPSKSRTNKPPQKQSDRRWEVVAADGTRFNIHLSVTRP